MTPLHTDPHHNLLAQVLGVKYVRLYPPNATAVLCPFTEGLTTNSSQACCLHHVHAPAAHLGQRAVHAMSSASPGSFLKRFCLHCAHWHARLLGVFAGVRETAAGLACVVRMMDSTGLPWHCKEIGFVQQH